MGRVAIGLSVALLISMAVDLSLAQPPGGRGPGGRGGRPGPGGAGGAWFENPLAAKDDSEQKILDVLGEMDRNQQRGNMNVRQADPNFVKAITTNPELETIFLQMDTSGVGVSMKKR